MSEKRRGARSKQTLQTRRRSRHGDAPDTETRRRGEFKSHAKFLHPVQN
ncbi:MAG: hypothetical protein F6K58_24155 [Symploca sp. SIO2E9]|nr:hypothetical protein [Symploca sp. SIO2E9]